MQLMCQEQGGMGVWKNAGRPNEGPPHEAKCSACNVVRRRIKVCAPMEERKGVQRRE